MTESTLHCKFTYKPKLFSRTKQTYEGIAKETKTEIIYWQQAFESVLLWEVSNKKNGDLYLAVKYLKYVRIVLTGDF